MEATFISETIDLWDVWIDLQEGGPTMLYVVGELCTSTKTTPVLLKKKVQGLPEWHLMLEVLPGLNTKTGQLAEIRYSEPIPEITKYRQVSICAGEDIIAHIPDIELVF
ncbi:MAG TPA: hypothetical protein VM187_11490 [Niastella sp.]|nr:hypothetical protein [Niastella sp.]